MKGKNSSELGLGGDCVEMAVCWWWCGVGQLCVEWGYYSESGLGVGLRDPCLHRTPLRPPTDRRGT